MQSNFASNIIMLNAAVTLTILILFYLHGADLKEEGICGSSMDMRRIALNKQLTAVSCEDYHCGKLINNIIESRVE